MRIHEFRRDVMVGDLLVNGAELFQQRAIGLSGGLAQLPGLLSKDPKFCGFPSYSA